MAVGRWVPLAEVARPHGVWGEIRLKVYNSDSELLFSQPDVLVRRPKTDGAPAETMMHFESVRGAAPGFLLAKFRGVDGRDAADSLRGAAICVERAQFPPLGEGEFYVCDVIGANVVGPGGPIAIAEDFVSYPSADVLVVRPAGTPARGPIELPLVDDFVDGVDAPAGEVRLTSGGVDWIRGLMDKTNHAD